MGNTVKFVFKTLIYAVLIMVFGSLAVEYANLSITSHSVRNAIETSVYNACNSFNQESYRSTSLENLSSEDGQIYMSGNVYGADESNFYQHFYSGISQNSSGTYTGSINEEYYKYLTETELVEKYDGSDSNSSRVIDIYSDLNDFYSAYEYIKNTGGGDYSSYDDIDTRTEEFSKIMFGLNMMENQYTPMNLNAIYLGMDGTDSGNAFRAVNNIFKWNVAQLWSNCSESMRHIDSRKYVQKDGWRIYTDEAVITEVKYYAYNVSNADALQKFSKISNISSSYYSVNANTGGSGNQYVMAARISYEVPAQYVGITPWARILNWAMRIGDQEYGSTDRDYTLNGSDSGIDITRGANENEYNDVGSTVIKTHESNGRDYYVWYYNIT